jgi:hypothetical protein
MPQRAITFCDDNLTLTDYLYLWLKSDRRIGHLPGHGVSVDRTFPDRLFTCLVTLPFLRFFREMSLDFSSCKWAREFTFQSRLQEML